MKHVSASLNMCHHVFTLLQMRNHHEKTWRDPSAPATAPHFSLPRFRNEPVQVQKGDMLLAGTG